MSADWKNKCWFTISNRCFIYDSNIYFGALIWFFAPSPASTYGIEDLPFSIEDVSQFQNRLVILYQSGETQILYYITFCGALNLGWMSILRTVRGQYWSFWCQGWSNHQDQEVLWWNRAFEAVEAIWLQRPMRSMRLQRFLKAGKSQIKTSESFRFLNSAYFDVFFMFWKRKFFGRIMKYHVEF